MPEETQAFNVLLVGVQEYDKGRAIRGIRYAILSTPEGECISIRFHKSPDLECRLQTPLLRFILIYFIESKVETAAIEKGLLGQDDQSPVGRAAISLQHSKRSTLSI